MLVCGLLLSLNFLRRINEVRNKFICVLGIVFVLFLLTFIPTQANSEISVYLNGEKINFDTSPMLVDGRTLVPFRGILEELGAEVRYEELL